MKFPLVSRKRLRSAELVLDAVQARFEENCAEVHRLNRLVAEQEARIAELESPTETAKRDIEVAEAKIVLAELEIKLRRLKEDPDPEDVRSERPDIERVMQVAAEHRRAKVAKLAK